LVAPLLISAVAELIGFQWSFLIVAAVAGLYTVIGLVLPEVRSLDTAARRGSAAGFDVALSLLKRRGIQVSLLLTFVRLWLFVGWTPFFQLYLAELGFRPFVIGTVISANSLMAVVVTLFAGRLALLASKETVTALALTIGVVGLVISPHLAFIPFVYLPPLLLGIGNGLSLPLLMAIMSEDAPAHQRGVSMGLRTQANQAATTVAPVISGAIVPALGTALAFGVCGVVLWGILGTAMWLRGVGKPKKSDGCLIDI
jgi:predicted MFS family arabinose efflux permease